MATSTLPSSNVAPHQLSLVPLHANTPAAFVRWLFANILAALNRLDLTTSPAPTIARLKRHRWSLREDYPYAIQAFIWLVCLCVMEAPGFPLKLLIPIGYVLITTIPVLGQFFFPATPILTWLITFYSCRYIPASWRPSIHVALLPTLESVLYGANISDILTRYTHPALDLLAWIPYGVIHFVIPFVVAAIAFVFGPRGSINFWGKVFGYMNLVGVITQILFPCAAPWYEVIHGLTPAEYGMAGSPGGLARIDTLFGGSGYTETFSAAPLVFGAFPSLHAGSATMEALFLSHFFPRFKVAYWIYCLILYWATMYLTHHYLIDVVAGACLSIFFFYWLMPAELKEWETGGVGRFDEYDLVDHPSRNIASARDGDQDGHADLDAEIRKLEDGIDASDNGDDEAQKEAKGDLGSESSSSKVGLSHKAKSDSGSRPGSRPASRGPGGK